MNSEMMNRVLLHECDICREDYRATKWRRLDMHTGHPGHAIWQCPNGHEQRRCDTPHDHDWRTASDGQICHWCSAWRLTPASQEDTDGR